MAQRTPNTPFDTKNRILLKALHKDASKNSANSILELLKSVSDANAQMSGLLVGESLQAAKEQTVSPIVFIAVLRPVLNRFL